MTEDEKWEFLVELDETHLRGGVILSEWAVFIIKSADIAFVNSANIACIITSLAGIETYLRAEFDSKKHRLIDLIEESDLDSKLKQELQILRKYRNKWVHVESPWDDDKLLNSSEQCESELEEMAKRCTIALRQTIYSDPWI